MLAIMSRIVELHPHNPNWAATYQTEAAKLKPIFGKLLLLTEHIGSTAIPGIKAKPIIDIMIAVSNLACVADFIPEMELLGYEHRGEAGIPGRQYFRREADSIGGYHVHIYQLGHAAITQALNFSEYLRTHPDRAQAYSHLKEGLAKKFRNDRAMYTESKTDFIEETNRLAAAWREED